MCWSCDDEYVPFKKNLFCLLYGSYCSPRKNKKEQENEENGKWKMENGKCKCKLCYGDSFFALHCTEGGREQIFAICTGTGITHCSFNLVLCGRVQGSEVGEKVF